MTTDAMVDTEQISQHHFWSKLGQLKFDLTIYGLYFAQCVFWLRFIRIGSAVLTAAATGAWMGWNHIEWISIACPIVIFVLQTISAGTELLPYEKRKMELRELVDALDPLYDKMEYDWQQIVLGNFTIDEIEEKTYSYQSQKTEITRNYFKNDALPNCKRITRKAKEECDSYLSNLR